MNSEMGLQSSTYDKQIIPGHGNGLPGHPRKWKGRGCNAEFFLEQKWFSEG